MALLCFLQTANLQLTHPAEPKSCESIIFNRNNKPLFRGVWRNFGGGGGSRTRVRKPSAAASTRLVPDLSFASEASRGRDPSSAILCLVSPHPPQEIRVGYPG
jgi:hypothetical protein